MQDVRTWIEVDQRALHHNVEQFLKLIPTRTRFMAVVKSNAYGHGLTLVAKALARHKGQNAHRKEIWFGVDSLVEALRLRRENVENPILVLGSTLPARLWEAVEHRIAITVSNFEALSALAKEKVKPSFHIKVDTGMHRQGFLTDEISKCIRFLSWSRLLPQGIYTHFAAAKDIAYPTYTHEQMRKFNEAIVSFQKSGLKNMICHAAASGGTLLFPQSHYDMVRIGMGLYGYWPSLESRITHPNPSIMFKPVLAWKTIVGECKEIPKGVHVGYDLTERVSRKTKIAVLPIGYWHGYDRGLSSVGEVLIRGRRAKIIGRVSMDMVVADVTDIPAVRAGDEVVLVGQQRKETITADEISLKIGTSPYEFLTRINPLIRRVLV